MLETLKDGPNIIKLLDYVVDPSTKTPTFVSGLFLLFNIIYIKDSGICGEHRF